LKGICMGKLLMRSLESHTRHFNPTTKQEGNEDRFRNSDK
jgi:hypothetical protein